MYYILLSSQGSTLSEKSENGWAKLDNGLVVVWGTGRVWNDGNNGSTAGWGNATLPIRMSSIYVGLGNLSDALGAITWISLSSTGTVINTRWDACGYISTPTRWRYLLIGIPAN